jgi:hypothetical protein
MIQDKVKVSDFRASVLESKAFDLCKITGSFDIEYSIMT